ncbi:hypothetical protein CBA19CS91_01680 [Paraburkholderia hospita]|nr:hypothetical protein CBA19CS91_01680 [Paraburkholderia hospita]
MRTRFWMDTEDGKEVEVVANFSDGILIDIEAFSYADSAKTQVNLNERELDAAEARAIAIASES